MDEKLILPGAVVKPPLERDVQRDVKRAYEAVGCFVANFSQGYRPGGGKHSTTRQTKGIPDLYVFPPYRTGPLGKVLQPFWHETKRLGGQQTVQQRAWEAMCKERGVAYVLGGMSEAMSYLRWIGLVQ